MSFQLFSSRNQKLLFVLLCTFHLKFGVLPGWNNIVSDFPNYYISSKIITEGKDAMVLYNDSLFNLELKQNGILIQGQFSLYPPPTALIMLPISMFSPMVAKRVWLILNLLLIFACIFLISKIGECGYICAGNLVLITGFCLSNDLMLGQVYLFMLASTLFGYYLISKRQVLSGGFLLGFVMAIKYYTFILAPVYLFQKKLKPVLYLCLSFLLINLTCLVLFGTPVYKYFFDNIFAKHLAGKIIGQTAFAVQFQSAESLLNLLFTPDPVWNPHPFYESKIMFVFFKTIFYLIPLIISLFLIMKSRGHNFFTEISSSILITLLLLLEPGSATYHLLLLIFPIVLMKKVFLNSNKQHFIYYLCGVLAFIGFLSVLLNKIAFNFSLPLAFQYNRLWMLILFFMVLTRGIYDLLKENQENSLLGEIS